MIFTADLFQRLIVLYLIYVSFKGTSTSCPTCHLTVILQGFDLLVQPTLIGAFSAGK
jgi:hypothetical protein